MEKNQGYIISVASGEGLCELFFELGADAVLFSDEDNLSGGICKLIESSDADNFIVIPISADSFGKAEVALSGIKERRVFLLPSKTAGEAYAALAAIPTDESFEKQCLLGTDAALKSVPIDIRSSVNSYAEKEYTAISREEVCAVSSNAEDAVILSCRKLFPKEARVITLIVGSSVTDSSRVLVTERLMALYPDLQITVYIGGQSDADYNIAIR